MAKHRAMIGWPPSSDAGSATKPRHKNMLKFAGVPQTFLPVSAISGPSSPYCEDMWRRYWCLTSFFSDCRYMPSLRRYSLTTLSDGAQMAIFAYCLHPVFSASSMQHISDLHSKVALRPHHVRKYGGQPVSATAENRWGKKERKNKIETTAAKYNVCPIGWP